MNEDAREIVADLNRSLAEQPASTTALLEQPAHPALPPAMSLGLTLVTDKCEGRGTHREASSEAERGASCQEKDSSTQEETHPTRAGGAKEESISVHDRAGCLSTRGKFLKATVMYL